MAGLLDFLETPAGQGLLAAGLGAAASYGRGRGLLGNLGAGGLMGLQAYGGAQDRQMRTAEEEQARKLRALQIQQAQTSVQDQQDERDLARRFFTPATPGAGGVIDSQLPAIFQTGAAPVPAQPAKFDMQGFAQARMSQNPIAGMKLMADLQRMRPKYGTEPRIMRGPDGKLVNVLIGEDGTTQVLPFGVKPEIVVEDLGGSKRVLDKNSLTGNESFAKTMTPGESASNQVAWANNAATIRGQNMADARAREANSNARIPSGYRPTADGGLEFIPGGPADPNTAKRAAPTEFQGKSTTFAARMQDAAKVLDGLEGKVWPSTVARAGYKAEFPSWVPGGQVAGGAITGVNKFLTPADAQKYAQAQENWVTANLRQESGAAIGKEEMAKDIAKWFPQPGDSDEVIKQKAAARKVAERAMLVQAGPGASSIQGIVEGGEAPAQTSSGGVQWKYVNGKLVKVK